MQPSSYVNWIASLNVDEAFLIIVAPVAIISGIGALVFRGLFGAFIGTASTVGTTKAGVAAEIYAVVLGFMIFFGFDHFNETRKAVLLEASILERLMAEGEFIPGNHALFVQAVDTYVDTVLAEEWPRLEVGNTADLIAGGVVQLDHDLREVFTGMDGYDTSRIFSFVDEINELRAVRLSANPDDVVASAIFQMLIVGLLLSMVTGWFVRGPSIVIHMGLSTIVSGSLVMLMVLAAQLSYPFTGSVSIPKSSFANLFETKDK